MKLLLNLMDEKGENIADRLHTQARLSLVSYLNPEKREKALISIYGSDFRKAETFPIKNVSLILRNYNLKKADSPLVIEEYRRLERVLDYQRRVFCLDLDGLIIEEGKTIKGIEQAILEIRKKHGVVISTAAPEKEAIEMLSRTNINALIFGDLVSPKGKNYKSIDEFFGYAHPQEHLVAIGHSFEDMPADIKIPFIYLGVKKNKLAQALLAGVEFIEGKEPTKFRITKKGIDLGSKKFEDFFIVY